MVQALPLVESGAADAVGLSSEHLALACASHSAEPAHTALVEGWLDGVGLPREGLLCGAHLPLDPDTRTGMIKRDESPCAIHNQCSGKHAGFMTLARHLGAGPDYLELDHPVQQAIRMATEETAGEAAQGVGTDGCSAPNFALSLRGLGRQMAQFASAPQRAGVRARAMTRLVNAMRSHPELVAGRRRACTLLMEAMGGSGAVKTGADGVYVAILPELDRAIALKIEDGHSGAAGAAMAALLAHVGALDPAAVPTGLKLGGPIRNWAGQEVGALRATIGREA